MFHFEYYPQYEIDAESITGNDPECRTMLDMYAEHACQIACRHDGYRVTDVPWLMPLVLWYLESGTTIYLMELKPRGVVTTGVLCLEA